MRRILLITWRYRFGAGDAGGKFVAPRLQCAVTTLRRHRRLREWEPGAPTRPARRAPSPAARTRNARERGARGTREYAADAQRVRPRRDYPAVGGEAAGEAGPSQLVRSKPAGTRPSTSPTSSGCSRRAACSSAAAAVRAGKTRRPSAAAVTAVVMVRITSTATIA